LPKNLGLPFFSETGVPIIVGASVPPLPERNRCAFYFLRSGWFFVTRTSAPSLPCWKSNSPPPFRGLLFAKLTFPTCFSGLHRFRNADYVCPSPYSVTRFTPPWLVSTLKLGKYLPPKRVRNKTSLPRSPSFAQGNLSLRIMLKEDELHFIWLE